MLPLENTLHVGAAQRDITCLIPGIAMMGWAMHFATAEKVEAPLFARAFYFREPAAGTAAAVVLIDYAFVTLNIRKAVLKRLAENHPQLGLTEHTLMLTANHTHSAPGGHSEYPLYNLVAAGFSFPLFETIVAGVMEAIVEAAANARPAELRWGTADFAEDTPVAFNRAWEAHSANRDTENFDYANRHLAVERTLRLLRMDSTDGTPIGQMNWFAVHTTSVHSDQHVISPDNKGHAAKLFEAAHPGTTAAFCQAGTGDVTPNYQRYKGKKEVRGASSDDLEAMRINGRFQYEVAEKAYAAAAAAPAQQTRLDSISCYTDFTHFAVDPEFAHGHQNAKTGEAILGVNFMTGTREGEGVHGLLPFLANTLSKLNGLQQRTTDGRRNPVINLTRREILGAPVEKLPLPGFLYHDLAVLKKWAAAKAYGDFPLTPNILPVQILLLGEVAIAGVPGEPTTQAARRMQQTLAAILADRGIRHVVVMGYTNAYAGYITTYEEFQLQGYEGGSTHFGQFTCAAYRTVLKQLAAQLALPAAQRMHQAGPHPHAIPDELLRRRTYIPKKQYGFAQAPVDYRQFMVG